MEEGSRRREESLPPQRPPPFGSGGGSPPPANSPAIFGEASNNGEVEPGLLSKRPFATSAIPTDCSPAVASFFEGMGFAANAVVAGDDGSGAELADPVAEVEQLGARAAAAGREAAAFSQTEPAELCALAREGGGLPPSNEAGERVKGGGNHPGIDEDIVVLRSIEGDAQGENNGTDMDAEVEMRGDEKGEEELVEGVAAAAPPGRAPSIECERVIENTTANNANREPDSGGKEWFVRWGGGGGGGGGSSGSRRSKAATSAAKGGGAVGGGVSVDSGGQRAVGGAGGAKVRARGVGGKRVSPVVTGLSGSDANEVGGGESAAEGEKGTCVVGLMTPGSESKLGESPLCATSLNMDGENPVGEEMSAGSLLPPAGDADALSQRQKLSTRRRIRRTPLIEEMDGRAAPKGKSAGDGLDESSVKKDEDGRDDETERKSTRAQKRVKAKALTSLREQMRSKAELIEHSAIDPPDPGAGHLVSAQPTDHQADILGTGNLQLTTAAGNELRVKCSQKDDDDGDDEELVDGGGEEGAVMAAMAAVQAMEEKIRAAHGPYDGLDGSQWANPIDEREKQEPALLKEYENGRDHGKPMSGKRRGKKMVAVKDGRPGVQKVRRRAGAAPDMQLSPVPVHDSEGGDTTRSGGVRLVLALPVSSSEVIPSPEDGKGKKRVSGVMNSLSMTSEVSPVDPGHLSPKLKDGDLVEVITDEPGLRWCWFSGTVLRVKDTKVLVRYDELLDSEAENKKLEEWISLRGLPGVPASSGRSKECSRWPRVRPRVFEGRKQKGQASQEDWLVDDHVEVYCNDGWWEGIVKDVKGELLEVHFPGESETGLYPVEDVRRSYVFRDGLWMRCREAPQSPLSKEAEQRSPDSRGSSRKRMKNMLALVAASIEQEELRQSKSLQSEGACEASDEEDVVMIGDTEGRVEKKPRVSIGTTATPARLRGRGKAADHTGQKATGEFGEIEAAVCSATKERKGGKKPGKAGKHTGERSEEAPPKRGRGRPRKVKVDPTDVPAPSAAACNESNHLELAGNVADGKEAELVPRKTGRGRQQASTSVTLEESPGASMKRIARTVGADRAAKAMAENLRTPPPSRVAHLSTIGIDSMGPAGGMDNVDGDASVRKMSPVRKVTFVDLLDSREEGVDAFAAASIVNSPQAAQGSPREIGTAQQDQTLVGSARVKSRQHVKTSKEADEVVNKVTHGRRTARISDQKCGVEDTKASGTQGGQTTSPGEPHTCTEAGLMAQRVSTRRKREREVGVYDSLVEPGFASGVKKGREGKGGRKNSKGKGRGDENEGARGDEDDDVQLIENKGDEGKSERQKLIVNSEGKERKLVGTRQSKRIDGRQREENAKAQILQEEKRAAQSDAENLATKGNAIVEQAVIDLALSSSSDSECQEAEQGPIRRGLVKQSTGRGFKETRKIGSQAGTLGRNSMGIREQKDADAQSPVQPRRGVGAKNKTVPKRWKELREVEPGRDAGEEAVSKSQRGAADHGKIVGPLHSRKLREVVTDALSGDNDDDGAVDADDDVQVLDEREPTVNRSNRRGKRKELDQPARETPLPKAGRKSRGAGVTLDVATPTHAVHDQAKAPGAAASSPVDLCSDDDAQETVAAGSPRRKAQKTKGSTGKTDAEKREGTPNPSQKKKEVDWSSPGLIRSRRGAFQKEHLDPELPAQEEKEGVAMLGIHHPEGNVNSAAGGGTGGKNAGALAQRKGKLGDSGKVDEGEMTGPGTRKRAVAAAGINYAQLAAGKSVAHLRNRDKK
ncbi:hypothetical protein CBR_g28580 [Chara braunii]|uniref:Agenet domain-containing protein n=1 Tax=Chara braunii TaxID=69332 RepID=A0A388JWD1_CHABU|nr:hypothetical protein CBR_g28580 [Chara braunii]|eukprot:GBG62109.1 hypothetical protein CBR_g28580 [Chara braunii]